MIKYIARAMKRQVANRIAYIVLAVILALVPALIGGYSANAASAYDDLYRTTDDLVIGMNEYANMNCENQSFVSNWYTTALNSTDYIVEEPTWRQSLQNAINSDGRWIVSQVTDNYQGGTAYNYNIIWTEDNSLTVAFNPGAIMAGGNNVQSIKILSSPNLTTSGDCEELYAYYYNNNFTISNNDIDGENITAHLINIDENLITYPVGYDGELIENRSPDSSSKQTVIPTISATITDKTVVFKLDPLPFEPCRVNYMISYSTKNNNDYGETVIETLKNGWLQIFRGDTTLEEWRNGSELYDTEVVDFMYRVNPNDEQIVTARDMGSIFVYIGVETDWGGAPHKLCGDNGNPEDFEYEVEHRLQVMNIDGSNYAIDGTLCDPNSNICDTTTAKSDLMDCFTSSFPFISIDDCKKAVGVIAERLSFNRLSFGNSWIYSPQCEKLGVLGEWIYTKDQVICPYFPSYVRNTVDPFITFILGLLVVTYVAKSSARSF